MTIFYEGRNKDKTIDYCLTSCEDGFVADIFDSAIDDRDAAYLESMEFPDLTIAKCELAQYIFEPNT